MPRLAEGLAEGRGLVLFGTEMKLGEHLSMQAGRFSGVPKAALGLNYLLGVVTGLSTAVSML